MPRHKPAPATARPSDLQTPILAIAAKMQGAEIKAGRERAGITQADAAKLCGVGYGTWIKWEYGKRQATESARDFLAKQWGLDRGRLGLEPDTVCPCCGRRLA